MSDAATSGPARPSRAVGEIFARDGGSFDTTPGRERPCSRPLVPVRASRSAAVGAAASTLMADSPANDEEPPSFEASLEALASVVAQLESGSLGLSESIAAYERGVALLRRLHDDLDAVEARVEVLVRIDEEGRPIVVSGAPAESGSDQPADSAQSSRSRSSRSAASRSQASRTTARPPTPRLPGMDDVNGGP